MNKTMTIILGHGNISSTVICDSITASGVRMTTLEIEYPRFILAEFNTHRMLSKNSSSSRAIPVARMLELLETYYAEPVYWGKNQSGMQAETELDPITQTAAHHEWVAARDSAMWSTRRLMDLKVHKQIANRVCEPWQIMKTVVSATEWANLWHLRDHHDAQPEFCELVRCMQTSMQKSKPKLLLVGEWHLPYVDAQRDPETNKLVYRSGPDELDVETAQQVSAACCAQVSYRRLDTSVAKAQDIYQRLIVSEPAHMSPVEHQATPQPTPGYGAKDAYTQWAPGITHQDRAGQLWSGNLRGWIQLRKILPNEAKW